ncbi:MAG: phosphatidylserine decarboxylase [Akkermansia sp.]|nr:phosphatidylserine decarboxylase [Akkermansia sp.]
MQEDGITYFNRYTGRVEREKVLGERALRWIYGTAAGRLSLHLLLKRAVASRVMGWLKDRPGSARSLPQFVQEYGIDMTESARPLEDFRSFNDFFTRTLKPGARPVCADGAAALPADARHSGWQDAAEMRGAFVKGQRFDLPALLGSAELARKYEHGTVVLSRLCPVDYHRFHFAVAGTPEAPIRIPGPLASVSPYCLRRNLAWLWTNKRELTVIHSDSLGDVLSLAVGATGVGAIFQTYTPGEHVHKAQEQGYFAFGGSTVMTFFLPGRIRLAQDILDNTANCLETYAHMGDVLGMCN